MKLEPNETVLRRRQRLGLSLETLAAKCRCSKAQMCKVGQGHLPRRWDWDRYITGLECKSRDEFETLVLRSKRIESRDATPVLDPAQNPCIREAIVVQPVVSLAPAAVTVIEPARKAVQA